MSDKQREQEISELKDRLHEIALDWQVNQAHINVLRKALEKIHSDTSVDSWQNKLAEQALSATPAQSLQAHDNEVIEKCAKVCDEMDNEYGWGCVAASTIRLMKGKE